MPRTPARSAFSPSPSDAETARDRILRVAEKLFGDKGYNGAPMREIASTAKVALSQLNYYFQSKQDLYRAVFLSRGLRITSERTRLLAEARAKFGKRPVPLRRLIESFVMPYLNYASKDGASYVRLYARLHTEPTDLAERIRSEVYDQTTCAYAEAFQETLPHLSQEALFWRLTFMMGTYNFALMTSGRLEVMSRGRLSSKDLNAAARQLIPFLEAGLKAPDPTPK